MQSETVTLSIANGVGEISLNRPEAMNAVNLDMGRALGQAVLQCAEDDAVRAVVLTGSGPAFCAGGDVMSFAAAGDGLPQALQEMLDVFHPMVETMSRMDAPVVAAVNGAAAGAGLALLAASSVAIASEKAKFTMAYTAAGLSPDGSSSYYLPRLIGMRRTEELMLTNRKLSAAEALDWGLVNQVVAEDAVLIEARKLAQRLATGPTGAYGRVRRLLLASSSNSLEEHLSMEAEAVIECTHSHDFKEGAAAFAERRAPKFTGH